MYIYIFFFIMSLGRAHIATAKPRRALIANHQRFQTTSCLSRAGWSLSQKSLEKTCRTCEKQKKKKYIYTHTLAHTCTHTHSSTCKLSRSSFSLTLTAQCNMLQRAETPNLLVPPAESALQGVLKKHVPGQVGRMCFTGDRLHSSDEVLVQIVMKEPRIQGQRLVDSMLQIVGLRPCLPAAKAKLQCPVRKAIVAGPIG